MLYPAESMESANNYLYIYFLKQGDQLSPGGSLGLFFVETKHML